MDSDGNRGPPASWRERASVMSLVAFFAVTALVGIDFGDDHWDEPTNVKQLYWALEHQRPFTYYYYYGSTLPAVLAVAAVPDLVTDGTEGAARFLMGKEYRLRARALLILLSSLIVAATWSLARGLGRGPREALLAAALVATSFQLGTHARFIAPDGLLAAITTGAMAALAWTARAADPRARRRWLLGTAAFVGLAAGTKYSAGILLVPVLVEVARGPRGGRAWTAAVASAVSAVAFFVSTPGALFETQLVLAGIHFQSVVYGSGWIGFTVDGPAGVAATLSSWLAFAATSAFPAVGLVVLAVAVLGLVLEVRRLASAENSPGSPTWTPWLMPVLTVVVYLSQNVFIARGFLGLIPFVAILFARGGVGLVDIAGRRSVLGARLVMAALAGILVANAAFVLAAADGVRRTAPERTAEEVRDFLASRPGETFVASPSVLALAGPAPNLVATADTRTRRLLALPQELFVWWEWPCNDPFLVDDIFGPQEIDWRWYTAWRGPPRVLLMDIDTAKETGASMTFTPVARTPRPSLPSDLMSR